MIRILRVLKKDLTAEALDYASHSRLWLEELGHHVDAKTVQSLAYAEIDGEYVNYYTDFEGSVEELDAGQLPADVALLTESLRKNLSQFLQKGESLENSALQANRQGLVRLLGNTRVFLLNERNPVLVPAQTHAMAASYEKSLQLAATQKKGGCLIPFVVLLLLLLLALGALWWFLLRPWPQEGTLRERLNDLLNDWGFNSLFKVDTSAQEDTLLSIQKRVNDMLAQKEAEEQRLAQEEAQRKAKEEEDRLKALEEARLAQEEARKKAEEEAAKLREEAEAARIKAEEEKKKAEEEKRIAEEEKKKAEEEKRKAEEALHRAQQNAAKPQQNNGDGTTAGGKTLPKCTTLRKEGKLPQMVIAFDGSESMLIQDVRSGRGADSRLAVATGAANNMIRGIDKNVNIGFVEINGCSAAKNHGFFAQNRRNTLINQINSINPRQYDGMTPLVDGLNKMADMVDGVNADAVGVLISDGEDTCPFTKSIDVCQLASKIHARKPRLKIHTILIGAGASKASCVARITGGKVFSPNNASEINAQLKAAGSEMTQVCKE